MRDSRLISPVQDHPVNAIHQLHLVEIDQQSQRYIHQLHVTEKLRLVDRQHFLDRLQLDDQTIIHKDIQPERFLKYVALVLDWDDDLLTRRNVAEGKLLDQAFFVDASRRPGALNPVDFDSRTDNPELRACLVALRVHTTRSSTEDRTQKQSTRPHFCVPLRSSIEQVPVGSFLTEGRKDTQRTGPHVHHSSLRSFAIFC